MVPCIQCQLMVCRAWSSPVGTPHRGMSQHGRERIGYGLGNGHGQMRPAIRQSPGACAFTWWAKQKAIGAAQKGGCQELHLLP